MPILTSLLNRCIPCGSRFCQRITTAVALAGLVWVACLLPTEPERKTRKDDLVQQNRIYQYLDVYSIYRDRVPEGPYVASSPESLAIRIHDTLYGKPYTVFDAQGDFATAGASSYNQYEMDTVISDTVLDSATVYFDINTFNYPVVFTALKNYNPQKYQRMIIDLRNNTGGRIDVADSCLELFLGARSPYMYMVRREYDPELRKGVTVRETLYTRRDGDIWEDVDVDILVDCISASAAEIFAAGVMDGRADSSVTLLGDTTYGKGIGQAVFTFRDGSAAKITAFRFSRVGDIVDSLRVFHRRGIAPDVALPVYTIAQDSLFRLLQDSMLYKRTAQPQYPGCREYPGVRAYSQPMGYVPLPLLQQPESDN